MNNQQQIEFNKNIIGPFSFLYDLLALMKNKHHIKTTDYYLWGGRNSGKSVSLHIFIFLCFLLKIDVTIYMFRNFKASVFETVWTDVYKYFKDYGLLESVNINISRHTITSKFSTTRFIAKGLHQIQSDNVVFKANEQIQTHYAILVEEESNEINQKDRDGVFFGTRGIGLQQIIRFFLFNPNHSKSAVVNYCEENLVFNEAKMRGIGIDFIQKNHELFMRSNWRCNEYVNSDDVLKREFDKMWSVSPAQAKCWDLGAVGVADDAIFAVAMKYISYQMLNGYTFHPNIIYCGLDFGFRQDAFACIVLGRDNQTNFVYVLDEFYLENKKVNLNHSQIAEHLIIWLQNVLMEFHYYGSCVVACDSADLAWIEIMNATAQKMEVKNIYFMASMKTKVEVGVGIVLEIMSKRALVFNSDKMYNLKRELYSLAWNKNSQSLKLTETDNHAFDALRYGLYQHLDVLQLESNYKYSKFYGK